MASIAIQHLVKNKSKQTNRKQLLKIQLLTTDATHIMHYRDVVCVSFYYDQSDRIVSSISDSVKRFVHFEIIDKSILPLKCLYTFIYCKA